MSEDRVVILVAVDSGHIIQEVVVCENDTVALLVHLRLLGRYERVAIVRTREPEYYQVGNLYFRGSHDVWSLE